ncbi:MAG: Ni-sirohydrochlorin a,c-diamide synthase [Methanothermobacter thermautotrophicus]|nr:Ni-sirohydrochlorin a,c-diamide synthase [Methanothermobacter thermautotrophicus]
MRVVLAGTGSAVGKTTIATGIMKALSGRGVQPFKVGPDYIDPSYHTMATGNTSRNLDSFFMTEAQIREAFTRAMKLSGSRMGIIEGVRGLYEGISPIEDTGSTASVAKALDAPVVLIINSRSLVKSAAAMVLGFRSLDREVKIEGVILNQVKNRRHYLKTRRAVEELTGTAVIGGIPRSSELEVEQRHLGLVPAVERDTIAAQIEKWGLAMEEYIDLEALQDIMSSAGKIRGEREPLWQRGNRKRVRIGVAIDEAFNFYYQENIEALEDNAASVVPFSPIHDDELPDVDAIYIGGGYPEIFAAELESNTSMRKSIQRFHADGRPIFGECGGLMYLMSSIDEREMCGVFPHPAEMTGRVQGLSYVIAEAVMDNLITEAGDKFRGHEFHYSRVLGASGGKFAFRVLRGRGIVDSLDGITSGSSLASYIHIHAASCPQFAANFTRNAWEF